MTPEEATPALAEKSRRNASASGIEEVVCGIFREVLDNGETMDVTRSFFHMGGTSIMAAKVAARISARYGIRLSLRYVFEYPTVKDLAQVVESEIRRDVAGLSDDEIVAMTTREK
ncbi:phosphopantetheine-binding protein [Streptomyces sp. NPDC014746]|uniref:phosphopantetheine-binding protein n=1 Tax=Streptomyces sp. NPDC014746 TaxID=3364904 RepID=UPI0036FEAF8F